MTKQQILYTAQKEADILALKKMLTQLKEENQTLKEANRQLVTFIEGHFPGYSIQRTRDKNK
jgi:hypothetical protein